MDGKSNGEEQIAAGFCQCGCGSTTGMWTKTHRPKGRVKGRPKGFVRGRNGRTSGYQDLSKAYKVEERGCESPCWIWVKAVLPSGYGHCWDGRTGRMKGAHIVFYENKLGPVLEGLELDHLCRVTECVNPDHLEAVTHTENVRRSIAARKVMRSVSDPIRLNQGVVVNEAGQKNPEVAHEQVTEGRK